MNIYFIFFFYQIVNSSTSRKHGKKKTFYPGSVQYVMSSYKFKVNNESVKDHCV